MTGGTIERAGAVRVDLPHTLGDHCTSSALRDLLRFHGLSWDGRPLSEGMVFGLAGGLGLGFAELDWMEPPIYLIGRSAHFEQNLCDNLGIGGGLHQTDDPDEGWRLLKAELDDGRPTLIWTDIQELEYLDARYVNSMHAVVACGYDEEAGIALVADNDRDGLQSCSLDSLRRARSSQGFPVPNRHGLWRLEFPAELPPAADAIETGVRQGIERMTELHAEHVPPGLERVDAFAESYPTWPERFGESLEPALRGLRAFVVKAGTGGTLCRSLQARFLADSSRLLGDPALDAMARTYARLALAWVDLADAVRDDDPRAGHRDGAACLDRIRQLEHRGVEEAVEWVEARA
jgi:Butirosin biosynthesis protein H, N-terminal/Domain of unknown function (DUF4872)